MRSQGKSVFLMNDNCTPASEYFLFNYLNCKSGLGMCSTTDKKLFMVLEFDFEDPCLEQSLKPVQCDLSHRQKGTGSAFQT